VIVISTKIEWFVVFDTQTSHPSKKIIGRHTRVTVAYISGASENDQQIRAQPIWAL